jgi:hypothetical protein
VVVVVVVVDIHLIIHAQESYLRKEEESVGRTPHQSSVPSSIDGLTARTPSHALSQTKHQTHGNTSCLKKLKEYCRLSSSKPWW